MDRVTQAFTYDAVRGQLIEAKVTTTKTLPDLQMSYCPSGASSCGTNNGNLRQQIIGSDNGGAWLSLTQTFTYDTLNRLYTAGETGSSPTWSQTYNYDARGNRWLTGNYLPNAPLTPTASTDFTSANRLAATTAAGSTNGYDDAGNLTSQNGSKFGYDAEGRLVTANIWNRANSFWASTTRYVYDGVGRRVPYFGPQ
jgi:hypothetical protein